MINKNRVDEIYNECLPFILGNDKKIPDFLKLSEDGLTPEERFLIASSFVLAKFQK